jgi:hypothetical protein
MADEDDIEEMPPPLGLYAGEMLSRAKQYLEAFKVLSGAQDLPYPTYFCLSHSLELFLKAFLASHGLSKKALKESSIRHNPEKLFEKCKEHGLADIDLLKELSERLQDMNSAPTYDFRYPSGYILHLPPIEQAISILADLCGAITPQIESMASRANLNFASDTRHLRPKKIRWSD